MRRICEEGKWRERGEEDVLSVNPKRKATLFVPRLQKSHNQKRFREAVAGEEAQGGKARKKRKHGGAEVLPEVSRVEVEEVGLVS